MSTQRGLPGAHAHRHNISLADLSLLQENHPNGKNHQFPSGIKHQHIKTQLDGTRGIFNTLRPHLLSRDLHCPHSDDCP